jgi:hypothetical integral membrane protein (TIGR02206 family)
MHNRFVLFGTAHLVVLALVLIAAVAGVWLVRRRPAIGVVFGRAVAVALLLVTVAYLAVEFARQRLTVWDIAPLHLCDVAIFVAAYALWTRRRSVAEVAYFWGLAGSALATVTPDLRAAFPDSGFIFYFLSHGLVIVAASLLAWGYGLAPRRGAVWRIFLITNAYAAFVGLVNVLAGTNYMYLRAKPTGASPLDWFGPWPVYILVGECVAVLLFSLLMLPFWLRYRRLTPS